MKTMKVVTVCLAGAVAITGCATRGQLKRGLAQQQAAIDAERAQRMSADSAYAAQLGAVQTDVASLRTDLQNLRTEFGAKITAMENGVKVTFPVYFAFDDANVRSEDQPAIDKFADVAQKHFTGSVITVEGFADPAGTQSYNLDLSRRRADAVRSLLLAKGMGAEQIRAIGYGKTRLVVPNASHDEPGAEQNRRVVFVIESKGQDAQTTASAF
jgi:outer membrane protein OmpA-like peptidoglycan-associated protein